MEYQQQQNVPSDRPSHSSHATSWAPPPSNFLKINCDTSFSNSRKYVDIAAMVRNCIRKVVDGINTQVNASSAHVVECLALRIGSTLIEQQGWQQVIVESDCKHAIEMVNDRTSDTLEAKAVVSDIRSLNAKESNVIFYFVSRMSNQVDEWVARATFKSVCPPQWTPQIPYDLYPLL
ncbi:hypothetical protein V6N13_053940 [Hibiscus sabdariffa]